MTFYGYEELISAEEIGNRYILKVKDKNNKEITISVDKQKLLNLLNKKEKDKLIIEMV